MNGSDTATLLNDLLDTADVLVVELDCAGRIAWFNGAVSRLSGWSVHEKRGHDWVSSFVPAGDREIAHRVCMDAAARQEPANHKAELVMRDGSRRVIDWFYKPTHDENGQWVGLVCLGHDVTEPEKVREALHASEERAQGVLATAVNAIITISERGVIETVNEATERIFGYTRQEMIGQNISMLMPEPYRGQHDDYLNRYKNTGERRIIGIGREVIGQRKDGSVFPLDLSVGEVKLPSGRIFTGIIRDLTERKKLEEKILSISEEEQTRIGQDLHDDLCQQLAAIGCLAKVVHQRLTANNVPEALQLAEITRLITHANVRAREMSRGLMPVVLDSSGLMAALADLASSTERIFRVSCPFRCDPPVDVTDNKVAIQLYRIAQEGVANAIKHSRAERIELTFALTDGMFDLTIRDNGRGIPDHAGDKGTGMGLLTMSHRARMIGGTLTVSPDRFGGTIVQCLAPALPTPASPPP
jgi:PAS domain S-box-containing protein